MAGGGNARRRRYAPGGPSPQEGDLRPEGVQPAAELPLLVVVDSRGRVSDWATLSRFPYWRGVVAVCSESTPAGHLERLQEASIETIVAGSGRVDLAAALTALRERHGIETVRVDSGGGLNGPLLRAGLVDELSLLVHPALAGGEGPVFWGGGPEFPPLNVRLKSAEVVAGGLVWLLYTVGGSPELTD